MKKNEKSIVHTQDNELSHSMVHYLLAIHKLKEGKGYARVTDIAKNLNLTKGSVSTALMGLKKRELVREEEESKFLFLSEKGHQEVHRILSSRTLLYYFLKDMLGVSESNSEKDSCLMEHLMGPESRKKFFEFMKTLTSLKDSAGNPMFKTSLDLGKFSNSDEFEQEQQGDSHLVDDIKQ